MVHYHCRCSMRESTWRPWPFYGMSRMACGAMLLLKFGHGSTVGCRSWLGVERMALTASIFVWSLLRIQLLHLERRWLVTVIHIGVLWVICLRGGLCALLRHFFVWFLLSVWSVVCVVCWVCVLVCVLCIRSVIASWCGSCRLCGRHSLWFGRLHGCLFLWFLCVFGSL
jgi:hypothetical protein